MLTRNACTRMDDEWKDHIDLKIPNQRKISQTTTDPLRAYQ